MNLQFNISYAIYYKFTVYYKTITKIINNEN